MANVHQGNLSAIREGDLNGVGSNAPVPALHAFHNKEGGCACVRDGMHGVDHHGVGMIKAT